MEVGSGQLPLRSIVDNSVGERLEVEINKPGQVRPLLAALRHNKTVKVLQVMRMSDGDVLAVRRYRRPRASGKRACAWSRQPGTLPQSILPHLVAQPSLALAPARGALSETHARTPRSSCASSRSASGRTPWTSSPPRSPTPRTSASCSRSCAPTSPRPSPSAAASQRRRAGSGRRRTFC